MAIRSTKKPTKALMAAICGRAVFSLLVHPIEKLSANLVWEHFSEDDDRLRSGKQLCERDPGPSSVDGPDGLVTNLDSSARAWLSQGCLPGSLYAPTAYETPNAGAIPFVGAAEYIFSTDGYFYVHSGTDPYSGLNQSPDLRVIASELDPKYTAKNDTFELNTSFQINDALTLVSTKPVTNKDQLYSTEDYNRFNTAPGLFVDLHAVTNGFRNSLVGPDGIFCDPQLGCSSRLVGEDVSQEHAKQFSQEVRLTSSFSGPLNFSLGGNYLHYQNGGEDYFVFFNLITLEQERLNEVDGNNGGNADVEGGPFNPGSRRMHAVLHLPVRKTSPTPTLGFGGCAYVDPHPLSQIDGNGHNYFRSENPYRLNSLAGFGEVYYQLSTDLKLTGGLRYGPMTENLSIRFPAGRSYWEKGYPDTRDCRPGMERVDRAPHRHLESQARFHQ